MKVLFVGCGYVADYYIENMKSHPDFELGGAVDTDPDRLMVFCDYYKVHAFTSLREALHDDSIGMVLNLTNPRSHREVTDAALRAGKHVYSEKPLAMTVGDTTALVQLALQQGLRLGVAPCNVLNESVGELARAIDGGAIGKPTLAYVNFDDGMIAPREKPWTWLSKTGAPWPARDEFEVGCTYEHAGYCLTVLAGLFGPARSVTAHASLHIPDKGVPVAVPAPDFSVGAIRYDHGVVARVTIGQVAPADKSLIVVGSDGALRIRYLRNDRHVVEITNTKGIRHLLRRVWKRLGGFPGEFGMWRIHKRPTGPQFSFMGAHTPVDHFRGPQDMVDALRVGRPHKLSAELGAHIVEICEMLQYPERHRYHRDITSDFPPFLRFTGRLVKPEVEPTISC